ncbi:phage capsid protein [Pokkaliibacter plantistimulans]|uniref:Phage capsid protein n=1 Tax=Proteobacteria bacterium 228 TaxID=2083153 RepID=A0A2S5KT87_9PROT|nr:major capsid protein [Pokkaliibacter plantistimulans]PPC77933.1 phage capsid protein [Pokkaliibacter plantistimulans]
MDSYSTLQLLGVYRQLDRNETFLLNLLVQDVVTFEESEIAFDVVIEDMSLAPFCSPKVAGIILREQGGELRKFKPAYVKMKDVIDPERVMKRRPGEAFTGTMTALARRDALVTELVERHKKKLRRREEWMLAELLRQGGVTVEGEEYPAVYVDYHRDADKTVALTGAAKWDQLTADPNSDFEDWFARLEAPATHVIFGAGAFRKLMASEQADKLIDTRRGSDTKIELAPTEHFASYRGRFGGSGPELWTYTGWYKDDQGNKQLYIPTNGLVIVSTAFGAARTYGAIRDGKAGYKALEYFPKNFEQDDPSEEYLLGQSAPLLQAARINASMYVQVY